MSEKKPVELRVSGMWGIDATAWRSDYQVEKVLEEFEIAHRPEGFEQFFSRTERHQRVRNCEVAVAMEGFNGCARPLDTIVRRHGYRLYNINNLKLARFKEIFPGAAKSDRIDARKGLELSAKRSSAAGQASVAGGKGNARGERDSQAAYPAPAQVSGRTDPCDQ